MKTKFLKKMIEKEFRVNDSITLKLENGKTNLYVGENEFIQCKYLFLIDPTNKKEQLYIDSIDEAEEILSSKLERNITPKMLGLSPEEEFWGHCSNLQVWSEHDYDTRLLHSNIAFPLLKALVGLGDPRAVKMYKNELAQRYVSGSQKVRREILGTEYIYSLTDEELISLYDETKNTMECFDLYERIIENFDNNWYESSESGKKKFRDFVLKGFNDGSRELKEYLLKKHVLVSQNYDSDDVLFSDEELLDLYKKVIIKADFDNLLLLIEETEEMFHPYVGLNIENNKIVGIGLSSPYIPFLPECIKNFKNLNYLGFGNGKIKELPNEISEITQVKSLTISNSNIEHISDSIGYLVNLDTLCITNNKNLVSITNSISNLKKLKELDLCFNSMKSIPEGIGELNELVKFNGSNNNIKELPETMSNCIKLEDLIIHNNNLQTIPLSFKNLPLRLAVIWGNDFIKFPEHLLEIESIKEVSCLNMNVPEKILNRYSKIIDNYKC